MENEPKCETGCKHFYGGEIKHHKDCSYYHGSLSEMLDKKVDVNKVSEAIQATVQGMINWLKKGTVIKDFRTGKELPYAEIDAIEDLELRKIKPYLIKSLAKKGIKLK